MKIIDPLGRVTIPKDIREKYGFKEGTFVNVDETENGIFIRTAKTNYILTDEQMDELRNLFIALEEGNILDNHYTEVLANITKRTDIACAKCGGKMFYNRDNSYKCYNCKDED